MGGVVDFTTLKDWTKGSWEAQAHMREKFEEDFHFERGHHWSDEEKAEFESKSRIPIVFNRTAVIISSVVGSEINNRTEVRYIPREIGDAKANEVIGAGAAWFRDLADAEDADSEAFEDTLIVGLGATETSIDFEEDPEGEPTVERIDPLEFGYDMHARKKGLTDARYMFRVIDMPRTEAEERFPDFVASDINADWITVSPAMQRHHNKVGDEYKGDDETDIHDNKDTLTVVQIQWRERVKAVEYVEPLTGEVAELPKDQFERVPMEYRAGIAQREISRWEWHQAFLGKSQILDRNQPDPKGCTFNVITGKWDRKEKRWHGLLESMKDPQKFANKWLSQTLHILNTNAKGGVMIEEGAVEDHANFEETWAAADGVTWLSSGAIAGGRVQEKPKAQMPAAFMALTEFAITSIRDASGVNMELLGLRDANQPGVLEYQRRQAAMTTLAGFFDALRFYRKRQGVTILNFLRNYIAPRGQLVRLMEDGQERYVPLAMDASTERYDVIVDDAPQAPNEKEKAWTVIQALMPLLQEANLGLDDWADILEYSPLPSSFAEKVRAKAESQKNDGPSPEEQMGMMLEMRKTESEIKENEADTNLKQVQAAAEAQEAQLAIPRMLSDLMNTPQGASPA